MMEPEYTEIEETPEERAINDNIEEWHLNYDGPLELHEFLGWTWDEYGAWVTTGQVPRRLPDPPEGGYTKEDF